jgi:hypothetical protein
MVGGISQDRESCQFPFVFEENPLSYRSARPESGREVREGSSMELLARSQSERLRRIALAGGIRLSGDDDKPAQSAAEVFLSAVLVRDPRLFVKAPPTGSLPSHHPDVFTLPLILTESLCYKVPYGV